MKTLPKIAFYWEKIEGNMHPLETDLPGEHPILKGCVYIANKSVMFVSSIYSTVDGLKKHDGVESIHRCDVNRRSWARSRSRFGS